MHICVFSSLADNQYKVIDVILKSLKLVSLAPPLWILYHILKKSKPPSLCKKINRIKHKNIQAAHQIFILVCPSGVILFPSPDELKVSDHDPSPVELSTDETRVDLIPEKTRGFG